MRADRILVFAVLFLGCGLGLLFGYGKEATGFSAAYPLSGSLLHIDLTTMGPASLGGVILVAIGVVLLVWAFIAAIGSFFSPRQRIVERVVERYPVTTQSGAPVQPIAETGTVRRHFWSRPSSRTHI